MMHVLTDINVPKFDIPVKRIPIWENIDHVLVYTLVGIAVMGLVMVGSASIGLKDDAWFFLQHQAIYLALGVMCAIAVLQIPMIVFQKAGYVFGALAFIVLLLVLVPGVGKTVNGSTRWIPLGVMNVQASEVAKLFVIIYLAGYLVRRYERVRESFVAFLLPVTLLSALAVLLLLEPDFGATAVMGVICFGMLFLAGAKVWQFVMTASLAGVFMGVMAVISPYRMQRLTAFVDPWQDPFNSGFQLTQSLIAIGRGEWFGVGLGASVQKLFYLPEAHTDFIFAVLAEELGLMGVCLMILLYSTVLCKMFVLGVRAERAQKSFHAYMAYGIGFWFGFQAYTNMGVAMGLLPTKGLTLPLMSYGGSSLVVMCITLGILLRIDYEVRIGQCTARRIKRGGSRD